MSTVTEDLPTRAERVALTGLVAAGLGVLLGALDYAGQRLLPYPWADLANSGAVWAVAAFGVGLAFSVSARRAAGAGTVLLVVAVESYYLTATIVQADSVANLFSPATQLWLAFAVLAGALFGWAGAASRDAAVLPAVVGTALPAAVLSAEALHRVRSTDGSAVAVFELAAAVALVVLVARTNAQRVLASLAALPLALVGLVALEVLTAG